HGHLQMWDVKKMKRLEYLGRCDSAVQAIAVLPDGDHLLVGIYNGELQIWSLADRKLVRSVNSRSMVRAMAVLHDGRQALVAGDNWSIRLWNLELFQEDGIREVRRYEGHHGWVGALAILPNERRFLSGSSDCSIRFWDLESGEAVRKFEGHA